MAPVLFRIKAFFSWWLEAVDEHSLHSPFFFDLYTKHIRPAAGREQFRHIENLRAKLHLDHQPIEVKDLGAKSGLSARRKISTIARKSMTRGRFSAIYYRLAQYCGARNIIELGTCLGINTLYLAEKQDAEVTTFECAPALADVAALTFAFAPRKNIRLIRGDIDKTLPEFLQLSKRVDFALIDANHRYAPTSRYFGWLVKRAHEKSIVVVDDIHYSPEMERAWTEIKSHRLVYATADLFHCGIVFFDPSLNKQHVILQV